MDIFVVLKCKQRQKNANRNFMKNGEAKKKNPNDRMESKQTKNSPCEYHREQRNHKWKIHFGTLY